MIETTLAQTGQTAQPGVSAGNTFTYDIKGYYTSDDPNATFPDSMLQLNMTDYFKVTVTSVSGSDVSVSTVWRFTNGTEITGNSTVNVETGIYTGQFYAVYATNLAEGARIRPLGGYDQTVVNRTVTRTYGNSQRETNDLMLQRQLYNTNDTTGTSTLSEYSNILFDKQTGMLVELSDQQVYNKPSETITIKWKITDTNVWTVPELPLWIIPLFMVATLVAAIAYKKKHVQTGINSSSVLTHRV
jgi:hypothetical protein